MKVIDLIVELAKYPMSDEVMLGSFIERRAAVLLICTSTQDFTGKLWDLEGVRRPMMVGAPKQ